MAMQLCSDEHTLESTVDVGVVSIWGVRRVVFRWGRDVFEFSCGDVDIGSRFELDKLAVFFVGLFSGSHFFGFSIFLIISYVVYINRNVSTVSNKCLYWITAGAQHQGVSSKNAPACFDVRHHVLYSRPVNLRLTEELVVNNVSSKTEWVYLPVLCVNKRMNFTFCSVFYSGRTSSVKKYVEVERCFLWKYLQKIWYMCKENTAK